MMLLDLSYSPTSSTFYFIVYALHVHFEKKQKTKKQPNTRHPLYLTKNRCRPKYHMQV